MMSDARYAKRWHDKEEFYAKNGIERGKNLIVTEEFSGEGLDSHQINAIIKDVFLIRRQSAVIESFLTENGVNVLSGAVCKTNGCSVGFGCQFPFQMNQFSRWRRRRPFAGIERLPVFLDVTERLTSVLANRSQKDSLIRHLGHLHRQRRD